MHSMTYAAPKSMDQVIAALTAAKSEARLLAGGTDLLVQMRAGRVKPGAIIDLKHVPELRAIRIKDGVATIGACATGAELGEHPELKRLWPGVVEAVNLIGSTQVQGRATAGGNLCNGSPAADSVPALIAAGALCTLVGPQGRRSVPVESIIAGPGRTILTPGEFLVEFVLPKRAQKSADAYLRLIPRTEMDIAVVGAGVNLTLDDRGICIAARVALGAVAPTPLLVADGAAALIGTKVDDAALEKLAAAASSACRPIDDKRGTVAYRVKVAGVLARRAAVKACERARNTQ